MPTLYQSLRWHEYPLPGGAARHAAVHVADVAAPGDAGDRPHATLVAGVHGDEGPWGALALGRVLERPLAELRGRLRVVFAANPLAAEADARNAPLDGLDLNRVFPGDENGSHSERLAAALAPLIADSSVVIDLHGGGSWCVNAFVFRFAGSEALADLVGAPFVVDAPSKEGVSEKPGTLTRYAQAAGARVVAVEMGGRSSDELRWRDRIAAGVTRVLAAEDVLDPADPPPPAEPAVPVGPSRVLSPAKGGLFVPTLREDAVGTVVAGGSELGRVLDLHTLDLLDIFHAPFEQTALLLLRPHVCALDGGAMTYVVAEPTP